VFTVSRGESVSFSLDINVSNSGTSIGAYFVNPGDETKGSLALWNLGTGSTNDQWRFSSSVNPSTSGSANYANLATGTFTGNAAGIGGGEPGTLVFTYRISDDNKGYMTIDLYTRSSGSMSLVGTSTSVAIANPLSAFEIGFRLVDGAGAGDFVVSSLTGPFPVPEPAAATALLATAVAAAVALSASLRLRSRQR
jgi:hypothetical protein